MVIQRQLKISGAAAYTISNQLANASVNSIQNSWKRPRPTTTNNFKLRICTDCGYASSASLRQNCPAREELQNLWSHKSFCKSLSQEKKTTKTQANSQQCRRSIVRCCNNRHICNCEEQVNKNEAIIRQHSIYDVNYDSEYDDFDDIFSSHLR